MNFKKNFFVFFFIFILSFTTLGYLTFAQDSSSKTTEEISVDLNRDGIKDTLIIQVKEDGTYDVKAKIKEKELSLLCKDNPIGEYKNYWPLRVTLKDVTRDNIPEIFIQGTYKDAPIQSIFKYSKNELVNLSSSKDNILGFIDTTNNQSPKLLIGNFYNGEIYFKNYIVNSNTLREFNLNHKEDFMGKFTVSNLISYIETLPYSDYSICNNLFTSSISEDTLKLLDSLRWNNFIYKFQDAALFDISSDDKRAIQEVKWKLNFKGVNPEGENKNFTVTVVVSNIDNNTEDKKDSPYEYRITSLGIENISSLYSK